MSTLNEKKPLRNKARTLEILSVFSKHNFYVNGFTPSEMRTTLEDLGPTYVKIGQIMSSRTDILPESYCRELERLRSEVKPLAASEARRVIEEETGRRIEDIYAEFRDEPLGSAFIAQAHYGVLKDGTEVVTKVQRPGIAHMMRRDFALLKKLASAVSIAGEAEDTTQAIDLKSVIEELEKVSEEELDFRVEADNTHFLSKKMTDRMKESFDAQEKVTELLQTLGTVGAQTARMPGMVFDVLRNLVKGRMKINLELTGYEELLNSLNGTILNVVLALFSCILFIGSCILCTTDIGPMAGEMPLMSLIGFVVSVALGIYAVLGMSKRK